MKSVISEQIGALQRIATFSAAVRGHELADWHMREGVLRASCVRCGAQLRVYLPAFQPEMEGPVLDQPCAAAQQAA